MKISQLMEGTTKEFHKPSGTWRPARPLPFYNLRLRLKQAWDVLCYRADVLYWD